MEQVLVLNTIDEPLQLAFWRTAFALLRVELRWNRRHRQPIGGVTLDPMAAAARRRGSLRRQQRSQRRLSALPAPAPGPGRTSAPHAPVGG